MTNEEAAYIYRNRPKKEIPLPSSSEEKVLCFPRSAIRDSDWCDGFLPVEFLDKIRTSVLRSLPRRIVEGDGRFKQICTYCVVRVGSGHFARFLDYSRHKSGDEGRLHARRSIGVGGHVSGDAILGNFASIRSSVAMEAYREIREEISIDQQYDIGLVGVVNDDSDAVGRDHLGLVYLCSVPDDASVIAIEDCLSDVRFSSRVDLEIAKDSYESWSKILIDHAIS